MLCCIVDLEPCLLSCPGSSVGRALCLESRVSWVRVPPRAAPFSFEKEVVLVGIVMHLPCTLDSCIIMWPIENGMIMPEEYCRRRWEVLGPNVKTTLYPNPYFLLHDLLHRRQVPSKHNCFAIYSGNEPGPLHYEATLLTSRQTVAKLPIVHRLNTRTHPNLIF